MGLTRARLAGSEVAGGDVMVFLDSHTEPVTDWLRPILQRIKNDTTVVVTPIIDVIEQDTFEYKTGNRNDFEVNHVLVTRLH